MKSVERERGAGERLVPGMVWSPDSGGHRRVPGPERRPRSQPRWPVGLWTVDTGVSPGNNTEPDNIHK